MGVYFLGEITIGGPIPGGLVPELTKQLERAGLLPDGPDLTKYLQEGLLQFRDSEASYGCFRELEDFLQEHGVEFSRWSEGSYEYEPEMVTFRKETGLRQWPTDRDGHRVVKAWEVDRLLEGGDIEEARHKARELLGPDIPELRGIALGELAGKGEGAKVTGTQKGNVRTFKVDVNLGKLVEAGVIKPGRKWPKDYPPGKVDLWVAVFVQENPEDGGSCLSEVRNYVLGGDLGPRDLGVDLDATKAVYEDDQIPWARAYYEGPETQI